MRFLGTAFLIFIPCATLASSPEARKEICAVNAPTVSPVDAQKTEAAADCTDCLGKIEVSKEAVAAKKSAENITETTRKKRDLAFFKLIGFNAASGGSGYSVPQLKEQLKGYKALGDFYKALGLAFESSDQKLYSKLIENLSQYMNASDKKADSASVKNLKEIKEDIIALYDSRIVLAEKAGSEDGMYKSYYAESLKRLKVARENLNQIYPKIENLESLSYEIYATMTYPYLYPYNLKDHEKMVADTENKIAEMEKPPEEKKDAVPSGPDDIASEDAKALALYEKQVRTALGGRMEEGLCGMSAAEQWSIMDYTGSGYSYLNKALRSGDQSERAKIQREVLNSALSKLKSFTGQVKRGTGNIPLAVLEKHQVGAIVEYEGFTSTSTGSGFGGAQKFLIKSKTGKFVAPISAVEHESEVIFSAGTKFKVLDVKLQSEILDTDSESMKQAKKQNVEITMEEAD